MQQPNKAEEKLETELPRQSFKHPVGQIYYLIAPCTYYRLLKIKQNLLVEYLTFNLSENVAENKAWSGFPLLLLLLLPLAKSTTL